MNPQSTVVHFCEARYGYRTFSTRCVTSRPIKCENCNLLHATSAWYVAGTVLPFCRVLTTCHGHPQQEHETSRRGPKSRTRWTIDGPDDASMEIEWRKFSTNDSEGTPMMCNLVWSVMRRHVHIDYCRARQRALVTRSCITSQRGYSLIPVDQLKDFLTHSLFWKRSGKRGFCTFSLADIVLDRFQGPLLERRAGQFCEMVRFFICALLLTMIDISPALIVMPCVRVCESQIVLQPWDCLMDN